MRPFFEHYTLGEITTGRVESFLKSELAVSYSWAKHSRTVLDLLFTFALRNDAMPRNPVEGTSTLAKPKSQIQALTLGQVQAIRTAAATWRTGPGVKGPQAGRAGPRRDRGSARQVHATPARALALRPCDVVDGKRGMVAHVRGTVVYVQGKSTFRQDHRKTDASIRQISVPAFAAEVLRRRIALMGPGQRERTIFANRTGGPLSQHDFRRTFREFLVLAGLQDPGITLRRYRRTGATVLARELGMEAAANHLGHPSKAITEGHYVEPDQSIDYQAAAVLEETLRPVDPDGALLARPETDDENRLLDQIDAEEAEMADAPDGSAGRARRSDHVEGGDPDSVESVPSRRSAGYPARS